MTPRTRPSTYPQLEAFFGGYLHQDFVEEHGTLAGAVAAFARDASVRERRAHAREWKAFRKDARHAVTLASTSCLSASGDVQTPSLSNWMT